MNVLVLGSGGREHALAWKIAQSPLLNKLFIAPGNAGTNSVGENIKLNLSDFSEIKEFVLDQSIDLLLVGPEGPLVEGIKDFFTKELPSLAVIGPDSNGAMLEGSKDFAKEFMHKYKVPTAAYETFTKDTLEQGYKFLSTLKPPYVLKADGLAAGKGVVILNDFEKAKIELKSMLVDAKFGEASTQVVIEEFLDGIEMSVFVLTDGKDYKILPEAKDYKRIGEGDTGLNTGGMGAISPVPFMNEKLLGSIENDIVKPTIHGIQKEGFDYVGFVFIGLMIVGDKPYVIEYNVRMGDPETEVVIPRIKSDLLQHLNAATNKCLAAEEIIVDKNAAATVILVSKGYPEAYEKGKTIKGLENINSETIFHAGTSISENKSVVTNGGRVIAVTSISNNYESALENSYNIIDRIEFEGKNYRKDIGFDLE